MTPEQQALIVGALAALIGSITFAVKTLATTAANVRVKNADAAFTEAQARAKVAEIEAENERAETTTQGNAIKVISDNFVEASKDNRDLQKQLRDCEVGSKEKDGTINDLRRMNSELGERNGQQGKLLLDSSRRITALEGLESHLRSLVSRYEIELGRQLDDIEGK